MGRELKLSARLPADDHQRPGDEWLLDIGILQLQCPRGPKKSVEPHKEKSLRRYSWRGASWRLTGISNPDREPFCHIASRIQVTARTIRVQNRP